MLSEVLNPSSATTPGVAQAWLGVRARRALAEPVYTVSIRVRR
jgi:hypothetical protein